MLDIGSVTTQYRVTLSVQDRPGVLAAIAGIFSENGVSVETVEQSIPFPHGDDVEGTATLVIGTHSATEAALSATVAALGAVDAVVAVLSVLRIEGE
ncbi:hypothetical protein GCM10025866_01370 [Naasia aerilata]|uniref:ACT domain-containing protein n=1 Tax=Naasia aerilata TaxID=1162966 RepID=A0ABN6XLK2_9MICO|nr:hypothetical protein GCM10025866_01370 [Naasia aerilata]